MERKYRIAACLCGCATGIQCPLDAQAEEAAAFYTSIFKNSKIGEVTRFGPGAHGAQGKVMTCAFQLDGQDFVALNGGPEFAFTPAISFYVNCETQAEVDELWEKLSAGGEKSGDWSDARGSVFGITLRSKPGFDVMSAETRLHC